MDLFFAEKISFEEDIRRNVPINNEKPIPFVRTRGEVCLIQVKKLKHGNEKAQNVPTRS